MPISSADIFYPNLFERVIIQRGKRGRGRKSIPMADEKLRGHGTSGATELHMIPRI
jgi:hypothetical protein